MIARTLDRRERTWLPAAMLLPLIGTCRPGSAAPCHAFGRVQAPALAASTAALAARTVSRSVW
jgi:hypothetical protein